MADVIYLSNVRLSFPALIEAKVSTPGADPKFGADLLMKPDDTQFAKFMLEVGKVATEKWKDFATNVLSVMQNDRKLRCYGSGDEKIDKKTYKPYKGYEGMSYITVSANADRPPKIMRPDGTVADNTMERQELSRKLYGGCFVNAAVRPWPQDNQFGRAVRCELVAVQFAADGEQFGEADIDPTQYFKPVTETVPSFM